MTTEELLKPRYKVIADYPHMELDQHGVGDIISPYGMGFVYPEKVKELYEKYPHLFKPLAWWEEREESEMPEYFKIPSTEWVEESVHCVAKSGKWEWHENDAYIFNCFSGGGTLSSYLLPATESDYLTQSPANAGE